MARRRNFLLIVCCCLCLLSPIRALAQGSPSPVPQVPGDSVPAWVFYWVLGLSTTVGSALILAIKSLWERSDRTSGLSADERAQLKQLYDWHNRVDGDQVPLWYVPRSWIQLIDDLKEDQIEVKRLLTRVVEQNDGINADLRQQIRDRLLAHDVQQTKMLKLAMRVQQAIEALADLTPPAIESDLDDAGGDQ